MASSARLESGGWAARFSGAIEGAIVASLETGFNGYNQSVGAQAPHAQSRKK